jgi:hypothetical protein
MERNKVVRALRIAWTVWWGIVCVLLVVLWLRSYQKLEIVICQGKGNELTVFGSNSGTVYFTRQEREWAAKDTTLRFIFGWQYQSDIPSKTSGPFVWRTAGGRIDVVCPNYLLVGLCIGVALVPWAVHKWNFSLRTLLIATAPVAVVLGLVVLSIRY